MYQYVLMWNEDRRMLDPRAGAMFATATVKRRAFVHARRIARVHGNVDVYRVDGWGWDCPTIRAVFSPVLTTGDLRKA